MIERLRRGWWPVFLFGPLVLFGPMIVSGQSLFWGTPMLQFVPWRTLAIDWIRSGYWPLWNPYLGAGAPLLANYQSALLYPPNWIYFLTGPAWGQAIVVTLHLIFAGLGMAYLLRRLHASPLGQGIAGLAFSLSGYLVARAGFLSINAAAAWLPWIIAAADRLIYSQPNESTSTRLPLLSLSFTLAMQWLAGHAQTAWYSLVLLGAWALWRGFQLREARQAVRAWLRLAAAGLLSAGLAAAQLLPTAEYLANSYRAQSLDPSFALTYSFWPWRLVGLLAPGMFGSPVNGDYWGYGNYWEDAIYIGILPLILVLIALRRRWRDTHQDTSSIKFLSLVSVVVLILALGDNTPIFPYLFQHIPTFNLFQAPTRWSLLLIFSLAIMAGLGFDAWRPPEGRRLYWTRLLTAGAGVIGLAAWLGSQFLLEAEPTFVRALALSGLWMCLAGILALTMGHLPRKSWEVAVLAVVVIDLTSAGWGLNPSVPTQVYETKMAIHLEEAEQSRVYMPAELEYDLTYETFFRFDSFDSGLPWSSVIELGLPNTTALSGIPSANNFDPIRPKRYEQWKERLETIPVQERDRLLRSIGVALVAQDNPVNQVGYAPLEGSSRISLVSEPVPVASEEQALETVFSSEFDPVQQVVLEGEVDPNQQTDEAILEDLDILDGANPNRLTLDVSTSTGGWLVVADTYYPGWEADVDGQPSMIYPANAAFRAVWIPVGTHQVTFQYDPLTWRVGSYLSVLSLLVFICLRIPWKRK